MHTFSDDTPGPWEVHGLSDQALCRLQLGWLIGRAQWGCC